MTGAGKCIVLAAGGTGGHIFPARALAQELELKAGALFMLLRVAVTGRSVSPPLFESMEVLGRERCLRRLDEAVARLAKHFGG